MSIVFGVVDMANIRDIEDDLDDEIKTSKYWCSQVGYEVNFFTVVNIIILILAPLSL